MAEEQDIEGIIKEGRELMDDAIDHLTKELAKVRTGKASTNLVSGLLVDYYGTQTPLGQMANVTTTDSRTINIQPWDKGALSNIERCIFEANLGITPMNDGENVRLTIPPLTEQRRMDLVKQAKALGEDAKVSLRNTRHKLLDFIKKEVKAGYPEDAGKRREDEVQGVVKTFGAKVDQLIEAKEADIMTI